MEPVPVIDDGESQTIRLPQGVHLPTAAVFVRQQGDEVILAPVRLKAWPVDLFDSIQIDDPAFDRPDQGQLPAVKPI